MDWFVYDNGIRHERVKWFKKHILEIIIKINDTSVIYILTPL